VLGVTVVVAVVGAAVCVQLMEILFFFPKGRLHAPLIHFIV
jgi:hypothetical protein